ncbi:MAG: glycosyltransferase family 2 protein [Planctomycetota bacterium]
MTNPTQGDGPALSVIVPVYNEVESLKPLREELAAACGGAEIDYELIFVDDGSSDGSWRLIEELSGAHGRVRGIRFRRNFGKAAALTAGMRDARGERILMMDADLQDDPAEIPRMMAVMDDGADVVNGWKIRRLDPWHKTYPSKVFNGMVGSVTGLHLHDHNCGLKLFTAEVASEIRIYGELHRFIAVLAHARGFRVEELAVNHRPREFGHSKYGVKRFLRGTLDLITVAFLVTFRQRPQHFLGAIGLGCFGLGAVGMSYLAAVWVLNAVGIVPSDPIGGRPLLTYSVTAVVLGAQAISLGLLADLVVAYTSKDRDAFSIAEETDSDDGEGPATIAI